MLGGNLPGTQQAMDFALKKLEQGEFEVNKISQVFHSAAVDCVPGTPDFLDVAVTGYWAASARELLLLTQSIEVAAGRPAQHSSRESRILDIDIILFGNENISLPDLIVPHPRAREREFVLEPLNEIASNRCFPDGTTVKAALEALKNQK